MKSNHSPSTSSHQPDNGFKLLKEADSDQIDPEDVDIHGKLAHLNAADFSALSLNERYAMVMLQHPPYSDDLGRFMTTGNAFPTFPALSPVQTTVAIKSLIRKGFIETWEHRGSTCWEVAGAYAYKPELKKHLNTRRRLSREKKEQVARKKQRKEAAEAGTPFLDEDDGRGVADNGEVRHMRRTQRGNLIPDRTEFFFRTDVPQRKGAQLHKMLIPQPSDKKGCILRMLPSFCPADDLSPLGTIIRFYLLWACDDYGRVEIDTQTLRSQLGPSITKRISKEQIEQEIKKMVRSGHLNLHLRKKKTYGYIRDAAQHLKRRKSYNRNIPKLYDDRELTIDSDAYKAFFKACELHSSKRDKVRVADYNKKGDLIVVREYTSDAAARFLEVYDSLIKRDPYSEMSSLEFCGLSGGLHRGGEHGDYCFLHGVKSDLTAEHMKQLYAQDEERLSGESGDTKHYQIMTHVLGMTPLEYLDSIKPKIGEQPEADSSKTPITQSDHEQVPDGFPGIVPPDHDSPEEDSVSFDSQFGL